MTLDELKSLFPIHTYKWFVEKGYIKVAKCICGKDLQPVFLTIGDTPVRHALLYSGFIYNRRKKLKNGEVEVEYWTGRFGGWSVALKSGSNFTHKFSSDITDLIEHTSLSIWDAEAPQIPFICGTCDVLNKIRQKLLSALELAEESLKDVTPYLELAHAESVFGDLKDEVGVGYSTFLRQNSALDFFSWECEGLDVLPSDLSYRGKRKEPLEKLLPKLRQCEASGTNFPTASWAVLSSKYALDTNRLYHPSIFNLTNETIQN